MAKENPVFTELLSRCYDSGLMKEVYRTERALVCNVFDQFYIAFSLDLVESYTQDFPGFSMNSSGLRYIVEDDSFVARYFQSLSSKDQDQVLVIFNEKLYQHLLSHKEEFRQRPAKVDLAFEQEVMRKGPAAAQPKPKAKRSLFGFLRK